MLRSSNIAENNPRGGRSATHTAFVPDPIPVLAFRYSEQGVCCVYNLVSWHVKLIRYGIDTLVIEVNTIVCASSYKCQ